jgi:hypothetical protein
MCLVLEVSENGYYNWRKRGKSQRKQDDELFTLALEAQDSPHATPGEEMQDQAQQAFPQAEIAAASAEFFAALRLLLDITEE